MCLRLTLLSLTVFASLAVTHAEEAKKAGDNEAKAKAHPLAQPLSLARSHRDYIRKNVRDYTCQLIKRERIEGELQPYRAADMKVRCATGPDVSTAVLMQFTKPKRMNGRTVLFVDGQNENMVLVRNGGKGVFKTTELELDPHGRAARSESNYPITEIGFVQIMDRLIEVIQEDMQRDPEAKNTEVNYFRNAKLKGRVCTIIQLVHPEQADDLPFHQASLFLDDELHIPIRLVVSGWQKNPNEDAPVLEEYNYVNLKLNVDLEDGMFEKSRYFERQ